MANICTFSMVVRGKKENVEIFKDMMEQKSTIYMGRGAVVDFEDWEDFKDGNCRCEIGGWTKWSIQSSLIDNAISMRINPDKWYFGNVDKTKLSFVTLFEACEQLELDMECYSQEPGCEFEEHYLFLNGNVKIDDCVDYSEEYDEDSGEWIGKGGFGEWNFEI